MTDDLKPPKSKFLRGQCTLNLETNEMHGNENHVIIGWFKQTAENIQHILEEKKRLVDDLAVVVKIKLERDFFKMADKNARKLEVLLKERNDRLMAMLERLQFAHGDYADRCLICDGSEKYGHEIDCELGKMVKGE